MSSKTNIEWTDASWNPLAGCTRISKGCMHCYAETQAARIILMERGRGVPEGHGSYDGLLARGGQWNGKVSFVEKALQLPLRWRKQKMIFVNSMSDLFHESVHFSVIDKIFAVMALAYTTQAKPHVFQVLTKRASRMRDYLNDPHVVDRIEAEAKILRADHAMDLRSVWPLPNLWLGVSVEDQEQAARISHLLDTPAAVRWLSLEPLLGPVDLLRVQDGDFTYNALSKKEGIAYRGTGIDWVVVGGESGDQARPMHPDWAESLRKQCAQMNVPFFFKQWGAWCPRGPKSLGHPVVDGVPVMCVTEHGTDRATSDHGDIKNDAWMNRAGKKRAGRHLNGVIYDNYPYAMKSLIDSGGVPVELIPTCQL
ncbi:DUF5131 family protein [Pseudomonas aeruginosa]|uniref:DUF5131 family protein n=1 Tax=Pseudomonas aeruginosa TaxID=287 RepID=UPI0025CB6F34|nr:phage Gp37/Gp68 family protein [Pseudomonas aeruginosa]